MEAEPALLRFVGEAIEFLPSFKKSDSIFIKCTHVPATFKISLLRGWLLNTGVPLAMLTTEYVGTVLYIFIGCGKSFSIYEIVEKLIQLLTACSITFSLHKSTASLDQVITSVAHPMVNLIGDNSLDATQSEADSWLGENQCRPATYSYTINTTPLEQALGLFSDPILVPEKSPMVISELEVNNARLGFPVLDSADVDRVISLNSIFDIREA